jgi:hypothetical protein
MAIQIKGRYFIPAFAAVILTVAVLGFFFLRSGQDRRFAISIHSVPESARADQVPLDAPIVVRIDKRSAGRSPLSAFGMLLDGNGRPLAALSPLTVRELAHGKLTEEVAFPPLTALPGQRLLAAIVIRLPPGKIELGKERLQLVLDKSAKRQPVPSLPGVFGSILSLSRSLGGHAELTQVEVRDSR